MTAGDPTNLRSEFALYVANILEDLYFQRVNPSRAHTNLQNPFTQQIRESFAGYREKFAETLRLNYAGLNPR